MPEEPLKSVASPSFRDWAEQWKSDGKLPPTLVDAVDSIEEEIDDDDIKVDRSALAECNIDAIDIIPVSIDLVLKAPLDTVKETQKLYIISRNTLATLIVKSKQSGKIHPLLLGWVKECESLLKNIHGMTEGIQNEFQMKKMDLAKALIESNTTLKEQFKIRMIRELESSMTVKS